MPYEQLSEYDRYVICHMHRYGFSNGEIGRRLNRHRGTIGRELRRNRDPYYGRGSCDYFYDTAQRLMRERRCHAGRRYKLDHSSVGPYVRRALHQHWSPEQIVGRLRMDHPHDTSMRVSHETIYRWVYRRGLQGESWHRRLRRKRSRRRRRIPRRGGRGQIAGRVGIEHRPGVVDRRRRFGDWESDTVQGAQGRGALATHVERKSRYVLVRKLNNQRAETFIHASLNASKVVPDALRKTLTCDNGKEFTRFRQLEQRLGFSVYFARPYAAWERGTNENTNGLLREFFPKGTDFHHVSCRNVAKVQRILNNRPRKCLNYRTPSEVFSALPGVALQN